MVYYPSSFFLFLLQKFKYCQLLFILFFYDLLRSEHLIQYVPCTVHIAFLIIVSIVTQNYLRSCVLLCAHHFGHLLHWRYLSCDP